jgi:hypothetical protein
MGDPGLHSKFVEMQQESAFAPRVHHEIVNPYVEGLRLDRARILEQLSRATNKNHVTLLRRSLEAVESKLK